MKFRKMVALTMGLIALHILKPSKKGKMIGKGWDRGNYKHESGGNCNQVG